MKLRAVGATALLIGLTMMDRAVAGFFKFTPKPPPPYAVPEIDGAGAMVAIALLLSIAAIVYRRVQR